MNVNRVNLILVTRLWLNLFTKRQTIFQTLKYETAERSDNNCVYLYQYNVYVYNADFNFSNLVFSNCAFITNICVALTQYMIERSLKLTQSTFRLSLVRLSLSLDFSWYDRKQVLQDLSLVKLMSILCLSI